MAKNGLRYSKIRRIAVLCTILLIPQLAMPWIYPVHEIMGHMVYASLDERVKTRIDRMIEVFSTHYPRYNTFSKVMGWMDRVKGEFPGTGSWHYESAVFNPTEMPIEDRTAEGSLLSAINMTLRSLAEAKVHYFFEDYTPSEIETDFNFLKNFAFLVHLMGDLHCPAHSLTLYTECFPSGDRGGTRFKVSIDYGDTEERNRPLHLIWDKMFYESFWKTDFFEYANALLSDFPIEEIPREVIYAERIRAIQDWYSETVELGKSAYKILLSREEPYFSEGEAVSFQHLSELQLTLGAYRLAGILNTWL